MLKESKLLNDRGKLLALARKKVANDGYTFKKGSSRSKSYGCSQGPKRPRYDEDTREERLKTINDELDDIARIMAFKEKRLSQGEAARNYKLCEQVTEEVMILKSRRRELKAEKRLFDQKAKRCSRRKSRSKSQSSETDGGLSSNSTLILSSPGDSPVHGVSSPSSSNSRINPVLCDSPSPSYCTSSPSSVTNLPLN